MGKTDDTIRVLCVGNESSVNAVADGLGRVDEQFSVDIATSASAGLDRVAEDAVDCVVAEQTLPDGDGVTFLESVRESAPDLPFVLVAANGSESAASRAISAGVTEYLQRDPGTVEHDRLAEHVWRAVDRERPRNTARTESDGVQQTNELERYETVLTALGDPVYAIDADGRYTFVNDAFTSMTGYTEAELLGEHTELAVGEDAVEKGIELTRALLRDGDPDATRTCGVDVITAEGERIPCENHIALLPLDDGEFCGTAGVVRDVSDRRERERELERKNERLEQFASVISHDLRNPLNVATTSLDLTREDHTDEHLDRLERALDRMDALITDLLQFARQGNDVRECKRVALSELVDACWQTVATADATLVAEATHTIEAEHSRLRQLLENLFRNAVEHGGESVTVTVGDIDDGPGFFVADDGPGIPEGERDRVLEVGYSTSDTGTGFGLAIVKEIADAHGWRLSIVTSADGGARFEFTDVTAP
jgi:PAS domain S-box-containing protein